jgi:chaperone required for assembly of F1-ATPase
MTNHIKNIFKTITIKKEHDLYYLYGDQYALKTPSKKPLATQYHQLAQAIQAEWSQDKEAFAPQDLPMTSLLFATIDNIAPSRELVIEQIIARYEFDTIRYYEAPYHMLYAKQIKAWQPLCQWFQKRYDITADMIEAEAQISYQQNPQYQKQLYQLLKHYDDAHLMVIQQISALCTSVILAFAVIEKQIISSDALFELSMMERLYQLEQWGIDQETQEQLDYDRQELKDLYEFYDLINLDN